MNHTTKHQQHRIAIVGAGITGLATALSFLILNPPSSSASFSTQSPPHSQLQDLNLTITVFESVDSESTLVSSQGGNININGGTYVLEQLGLGESIREVSVEVDTVQSRRIVPREKRKRISTSAGNRNRDGNGNEAESETETQVLLEWNMKDLFKQKCPELVDHKDRSMGLCVMRKTLIQVLLEQLKDRAKDSVKIVYGKKLVGCGLVDASGWKRGVVRFADGTEYSGFDLVVGADSIRSRVREYLVNDKPFYTCIRVVFAVGEESSKSTRENYKQLTQYFGDGVYFLAFTGGAGKDGKVCDAVVMVTRDKAQQMGSTSMKTRVKVENADYATIEEQTLREETLGTMAKSGVPDEVVQVAHQAIRWIDVPIFTRSPFALSSWHKDCFVLVGDAAHAMAPFLGQGANQGLIDAYVLAQLWSKTFGKLSMSEHDEERYQEAMNSMLGELYRLRNPITSPIMAKSFFIGQLEVSSGPLFSNVRDMIFYTMGKLGVAQSVVVNEAKPRISNQWE